jgi:uncharacterized membrane protein YbhN (UPF0104 family)
MKRSLTTLLKAGVSVGLLAFFLSHVDLPSFLRALSTAQTSFLAVALLVYLCGQLLSSIRWTLLARAVGFENRFQDFAQYFFIGMFFNLFAPSTVGGDVGRVYYLAHDGVNTKGSARGGLTTLAAISVLTDRAIGMAVLIWVGAAAVAAFPDFSLPPAIHYTTFAVALGFLLGFLSLPVLSNLFQDRNNRVMQKLGLALETYRHRWRVLLQAMILSLVVHSLQAWMHVLIGRALGVEIPLSYAFIIYPLVGTFSALPVSLNGIGLREGGYIFLLTRIGISSEQAIAFGLLWIIVVALDSSIGGLIFVLKKRASPRAAESEAKNYVRK